MDTNCECGEHCEACDECGKLECECVCEYYSSNHDNDDDDNYYNEDNEDW